MLKPKTLISLFLLFISLESFAQEIPVIKVIASKNTFAIKNLNLKINQLVYLYDQNNNLLGLARVKGCKESYCFGQVTRAKKGFILNESVSFRASKLVVKKEKMSQEKMPQEKTQVPSKQEAYIGIGGAPVSYGVRFAYNRNFNEKIKYGAVLGLVSAEISNIEISGMSYAVMASYKFKTFEQVEIFGDIELGLFNSELAFTLDDDAPTINEQQYYFSMGASFRYHFKNNFSLLGRSGYAFNSFEESYQNDLGEKYTVPFAGGMVFLEAGVSYSF